MQNKQPSSEAFPVADSAPYPPLKVTGPNIQAACRLSQALAGAKSEMTAIMSYEYQHWILASCRPELAVTVLCWDSSSCCSALIPALAAISGDPAPGGAAVWSVTPTTCVRSC